MYLQNIGANLPDYKSVTSHKTVNFKLVNNGLGSICGLILDTLLAVDWRDSKSMKNLRILCLPAGI
jgi:hypothetical protein